MMINVCDPDKTKGFYKIGYLFAFFGSATTCRCCLGMRVVLAFVIGLILGLVTLYSVELAVGMIFMLLFTSAIFFSIWMMLEGEQEDIEGLYHGIEPKSTGTIYMDEDDVDDDEELIFDTNRDYLDYIINGIESIYGRSLTQAEEEIINNKFHEFKYQGRSGFERNADTGAPIMAQWIKILESGKAE